MVIFSLRVLRALNFSYNEDLDVFLEPQVAEIVKDKPIKDKLADRKKKISPIQILIKLKQKKERIS